MEAKGYSFKVLDDSVADADLFEGQTHEKVSDVLYDLIQESNKGITIGVEGGWGSGKSTALNFLRNKLEGENKQSSLFFCFDAWAHDGDPLRTIFLESLITSLDPDGASQKLQGLLKQISGRKKRVEVSTTKTASKLVKLLSGSALLIPAGAAMLGNVDFANVVLPFHSKTGDVEWFLLFASLLSFAPLLVLLYWSICGEKKEDGKRSWEMFESESVERYTQDITEEGERTSIEFEKYFKEIMREALKEDKPKSIEKFVIVIDNLDRIDSEHARSIWATLQTFFQKRSFSDTAEDNYWFEKLFFIVPYDRQGFSRIWTFGDTENDDSLDEKVLRESSDLFLSKCFQVIAEIPPPVMTTWVSYAERVIKESLEGWPQSDKQSVLKTYRRVASRMDLSPTPRKIRTFVNRVGILGMRWGGVMSPESIALYAQYRQSNDEHQLRKMLLDNNLPLGYQCKVDSDVLKKELAGMLFGVESDKGVQLLLTPKIKQAVDSGDGEALKELVATHKGAFWVAWQSSKDQFLPGASSSEEEKFNVAKALHEGLSDYKNEIGFDVKAIVEVIIASHSSWEFDGNNYANVFRQLMELFSPTDLQIKKLRDITTQKLSEIISKVGEESFQEYALPNLNNLISLVNSRAAPIARKHYPELDLTGWPIWLQAQDDQETIIEEVLPKLNLVDELLNNAKLTQPMPDLECVLNLLKTFRIHPDLVVNSQVTDGLVTWLNLPNRHTPCEGPYELLLAIYGASTNSKIKKSIEECISAQPFWTRAGQERIEDVPILPVLVAAVLGKDTSTSDVVSAPCKTFWNEVQNESISKNIFATLKKYKLLNTVWSLARDESNEAALDIIRGARDESLYESSYAVRYIDEFSWADDAEMSKIVTKLCEYNAVDGAKSLIENEVLTYHHVLHLLGKFGDQNTQEYVSKIVTDLSQEDWADSFKGNNYFLRQAGAFGSGYTYGFIKFFEGVLNDPNSEPNEWILKNFESLLSKTKDTDRLVLPDLAKAYFEDTAADVSNAVFSAVVDKLGSAVEVADEQQVMEKMIYWLKQEMSDRILWILNSSFKLTGEPLQLLVTTVGEIYSHCDDELKVICNRLNEDWSLGADLLEDEEDIGKSAEKNKEKK